jgi:hypothetical protein
MRTVKTSAIATVTVIAVLIAIALAIVAVIGIGRAADSVRIGKTQPQPSDGRPFTPEWTALQIEEKQRRDAAKAAQQLNPQQIQELRRAEFEKTAKPTP